MLVDRLLDVRHSLPEDELVVYHLLGCDLVQVADFLEYNSHWVVGIWVCQFWTDGHVDVEQALEIIKLPHCTLVKVGKIFWRKFTMNGKWRINEISGCSKQR